MLVQGASVELTTGEIILHYGFLVVLRRFSSVRGLCSYAIYMLYLCSCVSTVKTVLTSFAEDDMFRLPKSRTTRPNDPSMRPVFRSRGPNSDGSCCSGCVTLPWRPVHGRRADEPFFVETSIVELPIEAFDESVLRRLSGLDAVQFDAEPARPLEYRPRCQFGAVVQDWTPVHAAASGQLIEEPYESFAGGRQINDLSGTFAAVVVDDVEDAEAVPTRYLAGHEVRRSAPQPPSYRPQRHTIESRQTTAPVSPQLLLRTES